MRVLLVGPDHESNLSLRTLAASLRSAGHEPVLARFDSAADAPAVLAAAAGADLVGLSMCFQVRALEFLELAGALKRAAPLRPVVAGGHHASCAADELLANHPALDLIVLHEGEETLVELADLGGALVGRAGEVPGVVVRRDGLPHRTAPRPILADLDRLPWPDRSGPARLLCGVPTAYLMGSRGCVSDCDYCCITTLHRLAPGPRFRQRSPEDVADEMADLYHRHGVRQFVFHDDNFLVPSAAHNHERIGRLDGALRARGVRDVGLVTKCSPRDADRSVLEALRGMGLLRLFMGIESGSACGLASIGRRQTVEQSERALRVCEELGVSTQYTMIIFHPEATVASMLADLDFVGRHPAHPLNYCRAEIYAGTPLEARMLAAGRAEGSYLGRAYRYTDPHVATVWELGSDLFAGRCWGKDDLLGKVIRIDHQIAVLKRFYGGRKASALVRSFLAWQIELNLETAALFRELVLACADAPGAADPALRRAVADLARREAPSRARWLRQLCAYREALDGYARSALAVARRHAAGAAPGRRLRGPRHAAAVAAAIGMFGCAVAQDHGVQEAPPPPIDPRPPPPAPPDCNTLAAPVRPYQEDLGVAEAAPPPLVPPPPPIRKPPPSVEPPFRVDHGVAEAAPPPLDRVRPQAARFVRFVRIVPPLPLRVGERPVTPPFGISAGSALPLVVGGGEVPILARICVAQRNGSTALRVTSDRPVTASLNAASPAPTPAEIVLPDAGTAVLVLVDVEEGARVEVHLAR